jgi:DNA polymerase I
MARIIDTQELNVRALDDEQKLWVYCNLDSCVMQEIHQALTLLLEDEPLMQGVYNFERALIPLAIEMMLRGIRIDNQARLEAIANGSQDLSRLRQIGSRFGAVFTGELTNIASVQQLTRLLYENMNLPRQYIIDKGKRRLSTNRDALERLLPYMIAQPICNTVLKYRDLKKLQEVLTSGVNHISETDTWRMFYNMNVGGTETGRWSSAKSAFGGGTNMQNITERLRRMFIPDAGMMFCYQDLEQAESRVVAYESQDENYIAACESGDLHTYCARLIWPNLPWTGDISKDREIAERPFYRHFTYRDMSKRGGHATNYWAKSATVAKHLKIPSDIAHEFQRQYYGAFPGIAQWQSKIAAEVQLNHYLVTALGRKRHFFGRRTDDATLREAIAYKPQSTVGDLLSIGILRLWQRNLVQILTQVHDAALFQFSEHQANEILPKAVEALSVPIKIKDRTMTIPTSLSVGYNWAKHDPKRKLFDDQNPGGLKSWQPGTNINGNANRWGTEEA